MPAAPRIAIACQGGGSHAAFAAGVLRGLLAPSMRDRFELVALSGTSGGAMCATLAWAGLLLGGPDQAIQRLGEFWDDLKASSVVDRIENYWGLVAARSPVSIEISPYDYPPLAEQRLMALIERHIPFADLGDALRAQSPIELLIGATDVRAGQRAVFGGNILTARHLLASAAVPPIFRSIPIGSSRYWDGLFTSNPPVREFTDLKVKPEEIWVIRINPQRSPEEPHTAHEIIDRRNELTGNLALAQELYFIGKINEVVAKWPDNPWGYEHITVKVLPLDRPDLDYASKLDRDPDLIDELVALGMAAGPELLTMPAWTDGDSLTAKSLTLC